jgi:outer membrane receptor for ferrienterochelin and colicins
MPYLANALALGNWPGIKKLIIMICFGTALRYQYYDDNTTATVKKILIDSESLCTRRNHLNRKHKVLLGTIRLQHNHGAIFTPRLAYKWKINDNNIVRFNTGWIVNLFTEEHAALTGSREVIVLEELKPERSYNANLNYLKMYTKNGSLLETSAWYIFSILLFRITIATQPNYL